MKEQEMAELNARIAEHVMKWKKCKLGQIEAEGQFATQGSEIFIHDRGNYVKTFHPTTDPAAAMIVLEKCAEKTGDAVRVRSKNGRFGISSCEIGVIQTADTLPLAICLFAKELFK